MEAKLLVVGGKASKSAIALKLPTIIGRSREAGLTVAHPMISRQHCEVFEADGLLMVRDMGSLNGTVVGGQKIKETPLPPDGEFTVGPLTFRARYKYEGDLSQLPAPVLAEASTTSAEAETPDFQAIDEPMLADHTVDVSTGGLEQEVSFFDEILGEPALPGTKLDEDDVPDFMAAQEAIMDEPSPPPEPAKTDNTVEAPAAKSVPADEPAAEVDAESYAIEETAETATAEEPAEDWLADAEEPAKPAQPAEIGEPAAAQKKAGSWFGGLFGGSKKKDKPAKPDAKSKAKAAAKPAANSAEEAPPAEEEPVEEPPAAAGDDDAALFAEAKPERKITSSDDPADPDDVFDDFLDGLK